MKKQEGLQDLRRSAVVGCLLLVVFAAIYSWQSWREVNDRDQRQMSTVVEVSARALDIFFSNLEGAMMSAGETMVDAAGRFDEARAVEALRRLKRVHPALGPAVVADAEGRVIASSESRLPGAVPVIASPETLARVREDMRRHPLSIGRAFQGPVTGDWLIPVLYGVRGKDGAIQHLVGAVLPVNATQYLWRNAALPPRAALGVVREDGFLVGRFPIPADVELKDLYGKARGAGGAELARQPGKGGTFRIRGEITEQQIVIVFQRLTRAPLAVYASNPVTNRVDSWLDSIWVLWFFALAAIGAMAAIYVWSRRRQLAWDAEREQRLRDLERANQELESFNYTVSHDLRAPLRAVSSFGALLLARQGQLDEESRGFLERILGAARRMSAQVDHLLRLSRIARQDCERKPVDLAQLAREIVAELQAGHPGRVVEVTIGTDLRVEGDPTLLRAALQNLLENAWKFTSRVEGARIAFDAEQRGAQRVYCVRDNGAGFDMQYADKLFRAFERLHGEEEFPGTGIGLAVVARIVQRHGGRIWATSAPGRGASFCFTLGEA